MINNTYDTLKIILCVKIFEAGNINRYIWIYSEELNFIVFLSYLIRSYQLVGYGEAH